MITFCITSCNRFDLLERTIDSFLKLNKYPIKKYILNEDSGNTEIINKILNKYGNLFHIIRNPKNEGLLKSVDNLYKLVETEYIFHTEDDWYFQSNSNFITDSLEILENNKNIHQIWLRKNIPNEWIEPKIIDNKYQIIKYPHLGGWCGFSFNPGLRRKSDYLKMFPEGYNKHKISNDIGICELECNNIAALNGYRAAILTNPTCVHIGIGNKATKRN